MIFISEINEIVEEPDPNGIEFRRTRTHMYSNPAPEGGCRTAYLSDVSIQALRNDFLMEPRAIICRRGNATVAWDASLVEVASFLVTPHIRAALPTSETGSRVELLLKHGIEVLSAA